MTAGGPTPVLAANLSGTDQLEQPQQFRSRRAFIVWAVSLGIASHDRLTEAVVAEIRAEGESA